MKKIWIVGIGKSFEIGINASPHKFHNHYDPLSTLPTREVDEKAVKETSLHLFKYIPDGVMEQHSIKGFNTFHMEYTDNEERIKKAWYVGIIAHYKHLKWLEEGDLVRLDKRTERPIKRLIEEANQHREDFPELWI